MTPFQTAYEGFRRWIGFHRKPIIRKRDRKNRPGRKKLIVAGDLHVPFHDKKALSKLVREESHDTDLLIINGDLMDCWSSSRYPKSRRVVDPCAELAESQAVLTILAESFPEIVLVPGNHDERPKKFITDRLPVEMLDYIRMTGPMVFDPLRFLTAGLENVRIADPVKVGHGEFAFLYQHGDLVCSHAEVYSRISGRATGNTTQWLYSFALPAKVVKGPIRCVVQAHTHQSACYMGDFGVLNIEGGCLTELAEYTASPRIQTPRPWSVGWTVVYQDQRGRTDHRESRFIPCTS